MYRGFNISNPNFDKMYVKSGKTMFDTNQKVIKKSLDVFVNNEGRLDGSEMQNSWFPTIHADVFISHSHGDEEQAILLAGALYDELGLTSFIDSCVWGYANDLLKQIDNKLCLKSNFNYDYNSRNGSTSHVHMMLSSALTMMIDKTECLFFLNTPNSLSADDSVKKTLSPWIYYELMTCKFIKKTIPERLIPKECLNEHMMEKLASLKIEYTVDFTDFITLEFSDLVKWSERYNKVGVSSLDCLYQLHPLENSFQYI